MSGGRGRLLVGTSGWSYRSWHGDFYPPGLRGPDELAYLSERTTAAEINASFYRLQRPATYREWYERTPDGYAFAVKGSRYSTHLKRLRDPDAAVANLLASGVLELKEKLAVMLWQLPRTLAFDRGLVSGFLDALPFDRQGAHRVASRHDDRISGDRVALDASGTPSRWRHALEPRHPSFGSEEAATLLAERNVALVWSDSPGRWPVIDRDTADFRYVRLHGHSELYASRYSTRSLETWAERCLGWLGRGQDVHVYFDNDARGHAPHDALRLRGLVEGRG